MVQMAFLGTLRALPSKLECVATILKSLLRFWATVVSLRLTVSPSIRLFFFNGHYFGPRRILSDPLSYF